MRPRDQPLRHLGIGSCLITEFESAVKRRGLHTATVCVDDGNDGAKALYEKLGYDVIGRDEKSWESEDDRGNVYTKHVHQFVLQKDF